MKTHMFHPPHPRPPPLPPGDEQLNSPFSKKKKTLKLKDLHSLPDTAGKLAAGFTSHHRPPTVWSQLHILHVQGTLISVGNAD